MLFKFVIHAIWKAIVYLSNKWNEKQTATSINLIFSFSNNVEMGKNSKFTGAQIPVELATIILELTCCEHNSTKIRIKKSLLRIVLSSKKGEQTLTVELYK